MDPGKVDPAAIRGHGLVLAVERDPHVRELEAHFLGQAGYQVEFVDDGAIALERARQLRPDVLITEILLPKLDGLALCRQLKCEPATQEIAVVIFSILSAAVRAQEAGADAFLLKPLEQQRLLDTLRTLMAMRSEARAEEGE